MTYVVKRLWGIRHIRWYYLCVRLNFFLQRWASMGFLPVANEHDIKFLDDVWAGKR